MKFFTTLLALHGVICPTGYRTRPSRASTILQKQPDASSEGVPIHFNEMGEGFGRISPSGELVVHGEENGEWSLLKYWEAHTEAEQQHKTIHGPVDDFVNWAEKKARQDGKSVSAVINDSIFKSLKNIMNSNAEDEALRKIQAAMEQRDTDAAIAAETISQYLMHPSNRVKARAVETLGELGASSNPYVPILVSLASGLADNESEHPDEHVSWIALRALGKIGGDAWQFKMDFLQALEKGSPVPEEYSSVERDDYHKRRSNEYLARISVLSLAAGQGPEEASDFVTVFHSVLKTHSSAEGLFVASGLASWGDHGQEFVEDLVDLVVDAKGVTSSRYGAASALGRLKGSACQHVGKLKETLPKVREQIDQAREDAVLPKQNYEQAVQRENDAMEAEKEAERKRVEAQTTWTEAYADVHGLNWLKEDGNHFFKKPQSPVQESELQEMHRLMNSTATAKDDAREQVKLAREGREKAEGVFKDAETKVNELNTLQSKLDWAIWALENELSRPEEEARARDLKARGLELQRQTDQFFADLKIDPKLLNLHKLFE